MHCTFMCRLDCLLVHKQHERKLEFRQLLGIEEEKLPVESDLYLHCCVDNIPIVLLVNMYFESTVLYLSNQV